MAYVSVVDDQLLTVEILIRPIIGLPYWHFGIRGIRANGEQLAVLEFGRWGFRGVPLHVFRINGQVPAYVLRTIHGVPHSVLRQRVLIALRYLRYWSKVWNQNPYNVLFDNCEHVANFLAHGEWKSQQAGTRRNNRCIMRPQVPAQWP